MKYSKIEDSNGCLERIEKGSDVLANATEINRNEYYCISVGVKIFVAQIPQNSITSEDWGIRDA